MTALEILQAVQTARALYNLAQTQIKIAEQEGRLTDEQRAEILRAAELTDAQVDATVAAAKQRLNTQRD